MYPPPRILKTLISRKDITSISSSWSFLRSPPMFAQRTLSSPAVRSRTQKKQHRNMTTVMAQDAHAKLITLRGVALTEYLHHPRQADGD